MNIGKQNTGNRSTKIQSGGRKQRQVKKKINGLVDIYVNSSFNNTIITACEESGKVCAWASGGSAGFKNTKESTPFAAQSAAEILINKLKDMSVKGVKTVKFKGIAGGRESVLKTIASSYKIMYLQDITPIAFNGVRARKRRRS